MSWDSRVLWMEGLFLQPHHFQQADRHVEAQIGGLARRAVPYLWGVSELEIDEEILKSGQFALRSVAGLTPDGASFRVPATDDHPPSLIVPETIKDCVVYLTVPTRRRGAPEVDMTGAELSATRFRPTEIEVTDTMGRDRTPVQLAVGKLRLQFALEVDDLADRLAIPVARIVEVCRSAGRPDAVRVPARTGGSARASAEGAGRAAVGGGRDARGRGDFGFPDAHGAEPDRAGDTPSADAGECPSGLGLP